MKPRWKQVRCNLYPLLMVSNPVGASEFFSLGFIYNSCAYKLLHNCQDHFHLHSLYEKCTMNYSDVIYMMTRRFPSPYLKVLYALQSIYLFFSSTLNYSNFNGNCLYRDLKSDIIILQTFPLALMSEDREV